MDHVPRFVPAENYASNFGYQWERYPQTQFDSYLGLELAQDRFFLTTGWPRDLSGELILEAGCGAGRFTEIALATGATVVAMDFSKGVDANYALNGADPRLLLVQGDITRPPVPRQHFDRVFCMGVLQHTPSPVDSFRSLLTTVTPGGAVAIDVYLKKGVWRWLTSYRRLRWLTRHIEVDTIHRLSKAYVTRMWPVARWLWGSGRVGRWVARYVLLLKDRRRKGLIVPDAIEKEWLVLILIDQLSAHHDKPQSIPTVRHWFEDASIEQIEVFHGGNGVIGRGRTPSRAEAPARARRRERGWR